MKVCRECGTSKPESEFYKEPKGRDGLKSKCKACCYSLNAMYRKNNPERERIYSASYYQNKKDDPVFKKDKKDRLAVWTRENPDKKRAQEERYRNSHRKTLIEKCTRYNTGHREEIRAANLAAYHRNPLPNIARAFLYDCGASTVKTPQAQYLIAIKIKHLALVREIKKETGGCHVAG